MTKCLKHITFTSYLLIHAIDAKNFPQLVNENSDHKQNFLKNSFIINIYLSLIFFFTFSGLPLTCGIDLGAFCSHPLCFHRRNCTSSSYGHICNIKMSYL